MATTVSRKRPPRPKATVAAAAKKVDVRTPNVPGHSRAVDATKYEAMKALVLAAMPLKAPGTTQAEMMRALAKSSPKKLFPGTTYTWWGKTVQLDLEARGVLLREPSKPLRWHRRR